MSSHPNYFYLSRALNKKVRLSITRMHQNRYAFSKGINQQTLSLCCDLREMAISSLKVVCLCVIRIKSQINLT